MQPDPARRGERTPHAAAICVAMLPTVGILLLNGWWNPYLYAAGPAFFWSVDVLSHVLVPGAMLVWLALRNDIRPSAYGLPAWGRINALDLVTQSLMATCVFWLCYRPVAVVAGMWLQVPPASFGYVDTLPSTTGAKLLLAIYFAASAAMFEEVMYRGLPYLLASRTAPRRFRFLAYVAPSSLLFALAHWENGPHEVIATGVLGVVACAMYARIRVLWPLVVAHFCTNVVAFLVE